MNIQLCDNIAWLLSREAYDIYQDCMYLPTYRKYMEEIQAFIKRPSSKVYLCCVEQKIVGILMLNLLCSQSAEIEGIAVSCQYRNRGIGKMLITEAKQSDGFQTIVAQTDEDAVGFYRSCGFRTEPEWKAYPNGLVIRYNCVL